MNEKTRVPFLFGFTSCEPTSKECSFMVSGTGFIQILCLNKQMIGMFVGTGEGLRLDVPVCIPCISVCWLDYDNFFYASFRSLMVVGLE